MEVVKLNGDFHGILDDCQSLTMMILSTTRDALHPPTIWVYHKMCYPPNYPLVICYIAIENGHL